MIVAALLILILITIWVGLYQVVKQQGRIILRLDDIERQLAGQKEPAGLAAGSPFPAFELPDLAGSKIKLEDFRGKRVLVVNWNPQCGFCDLIAPDLARFEADFAKENLQLLLLAAGDAESNRKLAAEHGLQCPILLTNGPEIEPFRGVGTPAAYLLDEEGRVARPMAVGSHKVPALAEESLMGVGGRESGAGGAKRLPGERPLAESRIERTGLKAGAPAPDFRLPDIQGRDVALEQYRGRRVLLVFSDPHCGPCDQLAPELARLHRKHGNNGLAVILIGRGDPEENRRKAQEHGFGFPVVVQKKWELSKQYGIFSTPVAFLLGEDGKIARNVAVGPDAIVALAQEGLRKARG